MEIVVVSDTVRQRRSRTPSTSATPAATPIDDAKELHSPDVGGHVLPDLLPKTFHLVEASALFSQIQENGDDLLDYAEETRPAHTFAVVEIRETNIAMPRWAVDKSGPTVSENAVEASNTCSILESVNYMEPSCVETVHIVDVTSEPSDTETCPTPNPDDRIVSAGSDNETDSENEYDTGEPHMPSRRGRQPKLRDFVNSTVSRPTALELTALELTARSSFDDADVDDEPLIFSDDDDPFADVFQSADRQTVHTKIAPPYFDGFLYWILGLSTVADRS